jgi:hypothetical protein
LEGPEGPFVFILNKTIIGATPGYWIPKTRSRVPDRAPPIPCANQNRKAVLVLQTGAFFHKTRRCFFKVKLLNFQERMAKVVQALSNFKFFMIELKQATGQCLYRV